MKRISYLLIGFVFCIANLTSCIEGGNVVEEVDYGVLEYNSKNAAVVLKTAQGNLYSAQMQNLYNLLEMNVGECYIILYNLNYDLPENAKNVVEQNGYYTVTLKDYAKLPQFYLSSYLTDITRILPNEVAVSKGFNGGNAFSGYFFMSHTLSLPEDSEVNWNLSYDVESMMPTIENGKRYYDLYVRAIETKKGDKAKINQEHFNAYYVDDYLSRAASNERSILGSDYSQNSSKFSVRIFYASNIDLESERITWQKDEIEIYVASYLKE